MADLKISQLNTITTLTPATDVLPVVDVNGVTKKITTNQILGSSGTATLASATITGDLTVRTNKLAVTSTGVGVGTLSPNNTLTVRGSQDAGIEVNSADSNSSRIITAYDPANTRFYINSTSSGSGTVLPLDFLIGNSAQYRIAASGVFTWYDGSGGTRMTLNGNGLGVGVALYASWPATSKALQLGASSAIEGRTNDGSRTALYSNTVWNGTDYVYQNTAPASYYLQSSGVHSWFSAASGSGNISFGNAKMTLDGSGRLILLASTTTPATLSTNGQLTFTATSDTNLRFSYRGSDGVTRVANLTLA